MAGTTAMYMVAQSRLNRPHVRLALEQLAQGSDTLVIVTSAPEDDVRPHFPDLQIDRVVTEQMVEISPLAGLAPGILALHGDDSEGIGTLVAMTAETLGPIGGLQMHLDAARDSGAEVFSAYWQVDDKGRRVPFMDFAIFSDAVTATPHFAALWNEAPRVREPETLFEDVLEPLAKHMRRVGWRVAYPPGTEHLLSTNPRMFEPAALIEGGCPVFALPLFHLDPLLHDMNTIELKDALDVLRAIHPEIYDAARNYALHAVPMREYVSIADEYLVPANHAKNPDKTDWAFGTVAVFVHAYYTEMMPFFTKLVETIPTAVHLFVSTATQDGATEIESFLREDGYAEDAFTVRVVAQNRGRDMSSLFITWRDIILSGEYELALRLHSKRTPQVPSQVGESFKSHLFDNLLGSRGHVSNLLDQLEEEPDIGLITPPIIHIGFATLGHSWFNNKPNVRKYCKQLGFDVPLDEATPVTPYGTMFWFRTKALEPMFAHEWKWQDYNAEPHHFDGGLAHSQERLIGYCVQSQGFRIVQAMSPEQAARNYAKLEYKLQRLASHMPLGSIVEQDRLLRSGHGGARAWLFRKLRNVYAFFLARMPWTRRYLRPLAHRLARMLAPSPHAR